MKSVLISAFLAACIISSEAWPRRARSRDSTANNFVGDATDELSSAILQGFVDDNSNLAFSPLGYSVILAILAEGAKGKTRQELVTALKLPADQSLTRNTYKSIMERLKNTNKYQLNSPEFRNWFYVYKNYSVDPEYSKLLYDYYLTEVKSVERYEDNIKTEDDVKVEEVKEEVEQIEPLPSVEIKDPVVTEIDSSQTDISNSEKKKPGVDGSENEPNQDKLISYAIEGNLEVADAEKVNYPPKNIRDQIKLTEKDKTTVVDNNEEEIMEAVEARNPQRTAKSLYGNKDITASISANAVGSRFSKAPKSLMIMFNGLYFRGSWKTPFEKLESTESFYVSPTEKKQVPFMRSRGTFKAGSLPGLDSNAIELPYDGGRYSLLIVVPRERDGLTRLVADLLGSPLSDLQSVLQMKKLEVKMPYFYVETTTKPLTALAKFGISSIFGPEADLTGISKVDGLFVQEMVQHVSVKIDNANSQVTQLTASNPSLTLRGVPVNDVTTEVEPHEEFSIDHPFLFFIRDIIDDLIVVAGKIIVPEEPEEF